MPQVACPAPASGAKKFNIGLVAPIILQTQLPPLVAEATGDGI
jgi:hypothetical protein